MNWWSPSTFGNTKHDDEFGNPLLGTIGQGEGIQESHLGFVKWTVATGQHAKSFCG